MRRFNRVLSALALVLLAATQAAAGQLAIAWDANTEPDIAGYVVEWGSGSAPYANTVDVGNVTSWTLANAVEGTTYSFRVVAYDWEGTAERAASKGREDWARWIRTGYAA